MQNALIHTEVLTGVIHSWVSSDLPSNSFSVINFSWATVDVDPPTGCLVVLQHPEDEDQMFQVLISCPRQPIIHIIHIPLSDCEHCLYVAWEVLLGLDIMLYYSSPDTPIWFSVDPGSWHPGLQFISVLHCIQGDISRICQCGVPHLSTWILPVGSVLNHLYERALTFSYIRLILSSSSGCLMSINVQLFNYLTN